MHLPAIFRPAAAAALAVGVALAVPAAAQAHVTVSADKAVQGGYAKLVFRVPNESDTASTTKLVITLPQDTPIASIRTKPKPGWTAAIGRAKLAKPVKAGEATLTEAPATVTFTAAKGAAIGPGQFDEFELSGGPLPTAEQLTLPAAQYYSDGTVVNWNEPNTAGQAEPEHPAPVLALAEATDAGHHAEAAGDTGAAGGAEESGGEESGGEDGLARGLGIAALVVALVAAGLGALALRRRPAASA